LRYYYPPQIGADLSAGFDTFRELDNEGDDHIDALLKTIIETEKREGKRCEADFVTWRGMMTKVCMCSLRSRIYIDYIQIMTAPFDRFNR